MKKALLLALALIMLTRPDGAPIWIASDSIEVVHKTGECSGTEVRTSTGHFCVRETVEEIVSKIEGASDD